MPGMPGVEYGVIQVQDRERKFNYKRLLRGIVRNVKLLSLSKDSMKRKRAQQIDDVVLLWFSSEYERQNKISDKKRSKARERK
uniref:Uncharacterized protein n=1 Tax=Glossina palpalis gambiensis TaxID=67801 RepID=A0A1B0ASA2_9MUSC